MIKWIKKKIDDFIWWITDDINIVYVILALIILLWIGTIIYTLATGGELRIPKQTIIFLRYWR